MGAVDVQQVDVAFDGAERVQRERPQVPDPLVDARGAQVLVEHVVVDGGGLFVTLDLLRSTIVARMRIDGEDVDALRRGGGEDHRRTAPERSDLDDLVA